MEGSVVAPLYIYFYTLFSVTLVQIILYNLIFATPVGQVPNPPSPYHNHGQYLDLSMGATETNLLDYIARQPLSHEKRVISFSLFGNDSRYIEGAYQNLKLLDIYFPGWTINFYVDKTVPAEVLEKLNTIRSQVIMVDLRMQNVPGAYWRFLVAADASVDRYIVRDVDSRLSSRDRIAVEEWIQSNKPIHILRDHPAHCGWPMNAGMWGATKDAFPNMVTLLDKWLKKDGTSFHYDQDQRFLRDMIWANLQPSRQITHDSYCCTMFPSSKPFPTRRPDDFLHVGQVYLGNNKARLGEIESLKAQKAPLWCRAQPEWEYG